MKPVEVLAVVTVNPDKTMLLPSRPQWKEKLREPGEYAVVRVSDLAGRRVTEPAKRVFHLGDLKWTPKEQEDLSHAGFAFSTQVRAAGVPLLRELLGDALTERLVTIFNRLGVPIPDRVGVAPLAYSKNAAALREVVLRGYQAYQEVWGIRDTMSAMSLEAGQSSFVRHSAGMDIVCGVCSAQHLAIREREAVGMVCTSCGNDLGVDFQVEQERLQAVTHPKR